MKTRAKFICHNVVEHEHQKVWSFGVVYHGDDKDHENFKFSEATPCGDLTMTVDKSKYKGEHPTPGKEYYLDISPAE